MNAQVPSKILFFDCFSGIAGDMVLASLLDLGLPLEVVEGALSALPLGGYRIRVEKEKRHSIEATRFFVDIDEASHTHHRHHSDIAEMIAASAVEPRAKELALSMFRIIAEAEARVHGTSVEDVHFHEIGAVDSIVDIVGIAAALAHLDARVVFSPIPLGRGVVRTAHGPMPIPAPATLFILAGVPVEGTEIDAELTTPTGAAVVKAAASEFSRFPAMVPCKVGFGAGARCHETRPGLLRAVLGEGVPAEVGPEPATCVVIESNIDDMTGEIAAVAAASLLEAGALDAWMESILMKKSRPAIKLCALCRREDVDRLAARLFDETPTIGLRYYPVGRVEMERRTETVETPYGPIRVKVCLGASGSANAAPELEDCLAAAKRHGVPVKRVLALAAGLAQGFLS